jgi:hypothetical protein
VFARRVKVEYTDTTSQTNACPIAWIDNFAMRNFTNDAIFDDTLPVENGLLEIGNRVPLDRLRASMEDWFHRKSYLKPGETLLITELSSHQTVEVKENKPDMPDA